MTVLSMRNICWPKRRYILGVLLLCLMGAVHVRGQVLAQRNWAGSGVSTEPWWERAVFYRIDAKSFQDSKGSGQGDLAGVGQRLGYLQSLGVDALILNAGDGQSAGVPVGLMDGFDDLARAAVDRHLRVLVEIGAPVSQTADGQYLGMARAWLNQGAAGLYVPTAELEKVDGTEHIAVLLQQLRALTDSFPGGRVLLAGAPAMQDQRLLQALAKDAQLTASAPMGIAKGTAAGGAAASLRGQLMAAMGGVQGGRPLLQASRIAAGEDGSNEAANQGLKRAVAVLLLASRGAVLLEYGQELGLDSAVVGELLMQWTPTNLTRKPVAKPATVAAKPERQAADMGFHPYVKPLPKDLFPPPVMPLVEESDDPQPVVVDPSALQGFTAGNVDAARFAANGATTNVAMEQDDPGSLLNLYRQLIELHHENATLRNGLQTVLNYDAKDALVWVRRPPTSSRTSSNMVVGCNLSDKPVALEDVGGVGMRGLRSLVTPGPEGDIGVLAGYAVLVGAVR